MKNIIQVDAEGKEIGKSIQQRLESVGFDKNHLIIIQAKERKSIEDLRIAYFNIHAMKNINESEYIKLLKQYNHLITSRSINIINEFKNFQKQIDEVGNELNDYEDKDNHAIKSAVYVQFMKGMLW